ncbi:hypothetical protein Trydic_g19055 [Trypoxylus dichotomus]
MEVLLKRKRNQILEYRDYEKPINWNFYLNVSSYHYPAQEQGMLNTKIISDEEHPEAKFEYLENALQQYGYILKDITDTTNRQPK